jgi:hypothetical protein
VLPLHHIPMCYCVAWVGLEPTRLSAATFEVATYASFATRLCAPGGTRTPDPQLKRKLSLPLSYEGLRVPGWSRTTGPLDVTEVLFR